MPTPPSADNYQVGGIKIVLGGIDLGDIQSFDADPSKVDVIEHYTARSGARKLDAQVAVQKRLTFKAKLDEHVPELYGLFFMGNVDIATGLKVGLLTRPLAKTNCVITYLNETQVIWSLSHSTAQVRPSGAMNMADFRNFADFEIEVEFLEDDTMTAIDGIVPSFGVLTFTNA